MAYTSPIGCTQQFRFCGNPFRIDLYKGCTFGCKYCFANSNNAHGHNGRDDAGFDKAKIEYLQGLFKKALETDDESKDLTIELLRHRVPLHCGGMSDPFQAAEFKYKLTYQLLELTNKYNYPIVFSTKQCKLPDEYYEILNPNIHAFQSSIMGYSDDFIKKYETNTPTAKERLNFVKTLREKGFWASIRIQPLVNLQEALDLVTAAGSIPSYITVEHLKLPNDNKEVRQLFEEEYQAGVFVKSKMNMRNIEPATFTKKHNIEEIKKIAHANGVKVGVGDNDLHYLSDSRCCCGVDTIGKEFDNYIKYNATYMMTSNPEEPENFKELWRPKSNCKECFFSIVTKGQTFVDFTEMTNSYINKYPELFYQANREDIIKGLFGSTRRKLF